MYKVNIVDKISFILVIVGALNWGLIGIFNLNLVKLISFSSGALERIIYILVFASSINLILMLVKSKFRINNSRLNNQVND